MTPPPPAIPGVRVDGVLGEGAAGVVYAGTLEASGQPVAVKIVRSDVHAPGAAVPARALQEGQIGWAINHPHVVRVLEFGRLIDRSVYLVMERLRGETLQARVDREGPLPWPAVLGIARQIGRGLCAIHARGAVHRDLKPENVFLCDNGPSPDFVKILDLGIARLSTDDPARQVKTRTGMMLGTPGYIAPEQARGEPLDGRCDLFALGATLYTALVGVPPFVGRTVIESLRNVAAAREPPALPEPLPADVAEIVRDLLQPDPRRRTPDAEAMLVLVDRAQGRPPAGFTKTTVLLGGESVGLGDLRLPTLGDIADHQRFRGHVLRALARVFPPGRLPSSLRDHLAAVDRLNDLRAQTTVAAQDARRAADALATGLAERAGRLQAARVDVEEQAGQVRATYLRATGKLMSLADRVGDLDRRYTDEYRRMEAAQRAALEHAARAGVAASLDSLYGGPLHEALARLAALQEERARLLADQANVRAAARRAHRAVSDLTAQRVELDRSLLAVDLERQTELAEREEAAREAEDESLILDRSLEHAYLSLGAALQRALAAR